MTFFRLVTVVVISFTLAACASMGPGSNTDKKRQILTMKEEVLAQLFALKPYTRSQINSAPGYAVFSNANVNLILIAAGTGYGVVQNRHTGQHTYMNMAEGGVGFGLGAKVYRIVMVFHTDAAMNQFINSGWTIGGNADAAAKASDKGGSIEGEAYYGDVSVYTFTETGIALQATIKGIKFWKDKELN